MKDLGTVVQAYVRELSGSRADDAWHSLRELGPDAVPHIQDAFRLARNADVRLRLAQVVGHARSSEALPFLEELLHNEDAGIWKTALDGLVMAGQEPTARTRALEILIATRTSADSEKRSWIDEAVGQLHSANPAG
jgi:hypothetical protein